jgi:hypothetical protein
LKTSDNERDDNPSSKAIDKPDCNKTRDAQKSQVSPPIQNIVWSKRFVCFGLGWFISKITWRKLIYYSFHCPILRFPLDSKLKEIRKTPSDNPIPAFYVVLKNPE